MIKLILVFISAFILLYNSFKIIDFINNKDNEKIEVKKHSKIIISTLTSIFVVCLFLKYNLTINFIKYLLLLIYLTITGYIDYKTQNVYTFLSSAYMIIGIIFFLINVYMGVSYFYIEGIFITAIIAVILSLFKIINWGDTEVFIVISIFLGGFVSVINIFFSIAISGFEILYLLITKKITIKDQIALCHHIAISTCLLMLFT